MTADFSHVAELCEPIPYTALHERFSAEAKVWDLIELGPRPRAADQRLVPLLACRRRRGRRMRRQVVTR